MLIGKVLELTPTVTAAENMSARLADRVRNYWLNHNKAGDTRWEENFYEDADGVAFLRDEDFLNLQGIDYILRWWGGSGGDDLAGDLEVLWKMAAPDGMRIYKTTIRFAERDFPIGPFRRETDHRDEMKTQFREAFKLWKELYAEEVRKMQGSCFN